MLSIFIMLFVAIGVAAGIGFGIVTLINTAQTSLTIQQNQVRLQNIANSVRAGLTVDAGSVLLPVRDDLKARLPQASPFSTTTSGGQIVYCPVFLNAATSSSDIVNDLSNGNAESYAVDTVALNGGTYAKAGHPDGIAAATLQRISDMGIIAYLLSPQPNGQRPVRCGDVQVASDNYTLLVDGGSVVPIYTMTTDARGSVFVLRADGSRPDNYNGTDRIVKTLSDVTDFITSYNIPDATVELPSDLTVSLTDFQNFVTAGTSRTLRLVPQSGQTSLQLDAAGAAVDDRNAFVAVGGNLFASSVTFKGVDASNGSFDVAFQANPAANVLLTDSVVGGLASNGGRIATAGATQVVPSYGDDTTVNPVVASGGSITLAASSNPTVVAPAALSVLLSKGGTINLMGDVKIVTSPTAWLNRDLNKGRVTISRQDDTGLTAATVAVSRTGTYVEEPLVGRQTVTSSAQVSGAYTATCPTGKVVVSGGCGSSSGTGLTSFGPTSDTAYSCTYAALPLLMSPVATAVCDFR